MAKKRLSLKPVRKQLITLRNKLKAELPGATAAGKKKLRAEIKGINKLLVTIPPVCHGHYNIGI